jgi:hypothetical protein
MPASSSLRSGLSGDRHDASHRWMEIGDGD